MSGSSTNKDTPAPLAELMASQDPVRLQILMTTLALANAESQALLADVLTGSGPLGTVSQGDPMKVGEAFRAVGWSIATNPTSMFAANMELMQGWMKLWQEMATESLIGEGHHETDKRFADPEWHRNPAFKFMRKAYDLNSRWLNGLADHAHGLPENLQLRAKFFTNQLTETLSPTNFLGTNPTALRAFFETGGQSVLEGLRLARADVKKGGGKLYISQTDETPFKLGENIATAEGQVVFRNDLIELIHYAPAGEQTYSRPLLIFPPWINKFYILDLQEKNSMIRWLRDKGLA
ncbi:MAG: class I poly(R)-hydroxyalkanoic acid synthase, partial [Hyphomonas sp.]|nr:class I poly(R)-hydroxyalkanoic acid synthase [Hyphomonas sp.]